MDRPPPDPSKMLEQWMEWERGEATPGRVMANLKTAGLRDLLEALVAAAADTAAGAGDDRRGDDRRGVCVAALGLSGPDDDDRPAGAPGARGGRQQLPSPANVRPGAAPPWARVPPAERRGIDLAAVRRVMSARGPSQPIGDAALPVELPSVDLRPAAVLCALFEEDGEAHVVLTRRSARLRSHTGEVSFPGGRLEGDEAPLAAALRETTEEIGLDPATVEILGQLSPLSTFANRSQITPFVGALPGRPTLHPNPAEVERAFAVPLAELVAEGVYRSECWELPTVGWREMYMFELAGDTVWGATARMLRELLDLIFEGPSGGT